MNDNMPLPDTGADILTDNNNEPGPQKDGSAILTFAFIFEGSLALVALALGWVVGIAPFAATTATLSAVLTGVLATTPMLLLLWWGLTRPDGVIGEVTAHAAQMVRHFFAGASFPALALVSMAAGFGEEALFRGVLQPLFSSFGGDLVGIVLAAVVFGLAHAVSLSYAVVAGVIGIYLGVLYLYTGNLMVPIVTHAVYDLVALLWLRR